MAGLIAALLGGRLERRQVTFEGWDQLFANWRSKTGLSVTIERALQCTTVLACALVLACGVGMLPLKLYRRKTDGGHEEAVDEPLYDLLDVGPNEWQTSVEWLETLVIHAALAGNGYCFINRVRGATRELIPIMPGQVTPRQAADYGLTYDVILTNGDTLTIAQRDMFHIRGPSWNAYSGLEAVRFAREAIGLSLATEETQARLHSNGARPGGFLSSEGKLTKEQVDQMRADWNLTQGGLANTMKTAILQGGLKWTPLMFSGVDGQMLEQRKFQIEEICRGMGVFPQMVGHSDKAPTYASAEAFFGAHVIYSLSRWTTRIEKRIAKDLLTPEQRKAGLYVKFALQALLRGDNKTRAEFYKALVLLGVMTRNEARMLEDLNPLPGLDVPLVPNSNAMLPGDTGAGDPAMQKLIAALEQKVGRVLSTANEARIVTARDQLNDVLTTLEPSA